MKENIIIPMSFFDHKRFSISGWENVSSEEERKTLIEFILNVEKNIPERDSIWEDSLWENSSGKNFIMEFHDLSFMYNKFIDASMIVFQANGECFLILENPNDGYRSSMENVYLLPKNLYKIKNTFPPQNAWGTFMKINDNEEKFEGVIFSHRGRKIGKFGTCFSDDFYPHFVCNFYVENLLCNQKKNFF